MVWRVFGESNWREEGSQYQWQQNKQDGFFGEYLQFLAKNLEDLCYRLGWATLKTIASSAILDLWKFLSYRFTLNHPVILASIESWWKDLSNDISADFGVQNWTPNHPFPLQSTDVAASNSFWTPPPRNSYRPQFGTASPITIRLIHSWYGPLVRIFSTFIFE